MEKVWSEKYRPDTIKNYVFRDEKQKKQIHGWIKDKSIPHLLFSGNAGTGKTTLAKILINELDIVDGDVKYINASSENGVDYIRDTITNFASSMPFGDQRIVFLDEADYLSPNAQAALRGVMEKYIDVVRFIMTCNYPDRLMPAIHSRCQGFNISTLDKTEFTARMAEILITEGIEIELDVLDDFVAATYPDMRKCINLVQMNSTSGKLERIDDSELGGQDYRLEAIALFRRSDYTAARKLICSQIQMEEYTEFYRFMYDNLDLWADTEEKQMEAIMIIRNGMVKHPMAGDPEINLSATLCELEILAQ